MKKRSPARGLAAARRPGAWALGDAWRFRKNLTFADATYVALAEHLDADLLTDDHKLANSPTLTVRVLRLPMDS